MKAKELFWIGLLAMIITGTTPGSGLADTGELAIGIGPGTLGIGADATVGISSRFNTRLGVNAFTFDLKTTQSDIGYDLDVRLLSFPILLDWHPFPRSGFRLSTGLVINKNRAGLHALSQAGYDIGGTRYTAAEVGRLSGRLDFDTFAPYFGLGWGNALGKSRRWTLFCDLGMVFQGQGDVSLKASGPAAADPTFRSDLDRERRDLEDELNDYRYYPVISAGLSYKF